MVQEGYSLNPVVALAEPHNPVYAPLIFALRAYLEVFVLKINGDQNEGIGEGSGDLPGKKEVLYRALVLRLLGRVYRVFYLP